MADKMFTLHIVILNHPGALPDAAEQPLVTGRNGSKGDLRPNPAGGHSEMIAIKWPLVAYSHESRS